MDHTPIDENEFYDEALLLCGEQPKAPPHPGTFPDPVNHTPDIGEPFQAYITRVVRDMREYEMRCKAARVYLTQELLPWKAKMSRQMKRLKKEEMHNRIVVAGISCWRCQEHGVPCRYRGRVEPQKACVDCEKYDVKCYQPVDEGRKRKRTKGSRRERWNEKQEGSQASGLDFGVDF